MTRGGDEDLRLASRCAAGEREVLEALVKRFSGLIYHAVKHRAIKGLKAWVSERTG